MLKNRFKKLRYDCWILFIWTNLIDFRMEAWKTGGVTSSNSFIRNQCNKLEMISFIIYSNRKLYSEGGVTIYNEYSLRGRRVQTTKITEFCKKCQHSGISWPYLKPAWEIHLNKYKHSWYWFINSWNSPANFRNGESKHNFAQ